MDRVNVLESSAFRAKAEKVSRLRGGVIMDCTTPDQARIAENAGAVAVMALERVPADIRVAGGVARMADPTVIQAIQNAVSIPVMAKARIGHFVEAQVLESLAVDCIDESEVLTPADDRYHIDKHQFDTPFVCGCRNLGEALRRIGEGAAMMRTKGEAGTGDIVEAVRHLRQLKDDIRKVQSADDEELISMSRDMGAPYHVLLYVAEHGRLPVLNFSAGGVATPADAALMVQLGAEGVFVGSGVFKSSNPERTARAIVRAVANYADASVIAEVSMGLGEAMKGIDAAGLPENQRIQGRGW